METFSHYWPFVRGIHPSPVNPPHKCQWRRALIFSLICSWTNGWVINGEAGDLRRYRAHYDVIVIYWAFDVHFISLEPELSSSIFVIDLITITCKMPLEWGYFPASQWNNPTILSLSDWSGQRFVFKPPDNNKGSLHCKWWFQQHESIITSS